MEGVPSWVLYAVDFSRGSAEVLAGERSSLSPRSLLSRQFIAPWRFVACVPLCILGPGRLRLLALGLGDAALDAEGGAVGAWDPQ